MTQEHQNIIFFTHKNHKDKYNGTSVYESSLLQSLEKEFGVLCIEPQLELEESFKDSKFNIHYVTNILKNVYALHIWWMKDILKHKRKTYAPENTLILVEDIYSVPIPWIISRLRGYTTVYLATDFGTEYSCTLFGKHGVQSFFYSFLRRIIERVIIASASLIIGVSDKVKLSICRKYPRASDKLVVAPIMSHSLNRNNEFLTSNINQDSRKEMLTLVFVGDCRYPPNSSSVRYLVNEVVPKLDYTGIEYQLFIVGARSDKLDLISGKNVKFLGPVEDLEEVLNNSDIGLAPSTTNGGLSVKVVEYLTHGLKVIATPEAAYGVISNAQLEVVRLDDFANTIQSYLSQYGSGSQLHKSISKEVADCYMTDKASIDLVNSLKSVFPKKEKSISATPSERARPLQERSE